MPLLHSRTKPSVPPSIDDWRPQGYGRSIGSVRDPIIEPRWGGVRVLARIEGGAMLFFDEDGLDCTAEFADLAAELARAALGEDLILDGFLTIEPTQSTIGTIPMGTEEPSASRIMSQMIVGQRGERRPEPRPPMDTDQPIAFVAVDLLRIDGSIMVDLPLLERKRILDGALEVAERIRITPYVRAPLGSFGATWRGLGFREIVYKAANSRYYPAARNDEWVVATIPTR